MSEPEPFPPKLVCVGETMVLLTPDSGGLQGASHLGVHPTGVYVKDRADGRNSVHYYRAGSAASTLGPDNIPLLHLAKRSLVHLSGITAAISPSADELVQRLLTERAYPELLVSFDVNYRPALWPLARAAPRLRELARAADTVLVGRDEAETLWGMVDAAELRAHLPEPSYLVVKDAEVGATCFHGEEATFVSACEAEVIDPVGAGDAFTAGFLAGFRRVSGRRGANRRGGVGVEGPCAAGPAGRNLVRSSFLEGDSRLTPVH